MSDDDLIRRGDAVAVLRKAQTASCTCQIKTPDPDWHSHNCRYRILREAEAMIDHVSPFAATLRAEVERLRGAVLALPTVYASDINTGVREVYDPLQRFYTLESVLNALEGKA